MNILFHFEAFPRLETERLVLREMQPEDAFAIFQIFSDEEVMKYYDMEAFTSIEQAEAMIERQQTRFAQKERFRWGITLKDEDVVIGTGGYVAWDKQQHLGGIGYDLARAYWQQGIMTEAVAAMVRFGFEEMGLNRIEAMVMPDNSASARLLQKLGFQEEGILHEYGFWKNTFHDLKLFALLKRDFL